MKPLSYCIILSLLFCDCTKHSSHFDHFRNGKFIKISGPNVHRQYFIERYGDLQKEYILGNPKVTVMLFHVKWTNDSTYQIWPTEDMYKKYPQIPKNHILTNEIIETKVNSYVVRLTDNSSNTTFTAEFARVK